MSLGSVAIPADLDACPRCGSLNVHKMTRDLRAMTPASTGPTDLPAPDTTERLRLMIAADCVGVRPRGPDGRRLLTVLIVWCVAAGYAWAADVSRLSPWGWAAALFVLAVLGAWSDRRAARKRGWVSAMVRARQIVVESQHRPRVHSESIAAPAVALESSPQQFDCADCGHRFERNAREVAASV